VPHAGGAWKPTKSSKSGDTPLLGTRQQTAEHTPYSVTVSIRVMSAGQGYRYLLNSVVVGDGARDAASALTRYYTEAGTPPGFWVGTGLTGLETLAEDDQVSEEQLRRLMGHGQHPDTGELLGRPYRQFATADQRIERRIDRLPKDLGDAERARRVASITAEENAKPTGSPVAGFDLTFSAPRACLIIVWSTRLRRG